MGGDENKRKEKGREANQEMPAGREAGIAKGENQKSDEQSDEDRFDGEKGHPIIEGAPGGAAVEGAQ